MSALYLIASLIACLAILVGVTWVAVERIRRGEPKAGTFRRWLVDALDAVFGLG